MEKINIKTEDIQRVLPQESSHNPLSGDIMITNGANGGSMSSGTGVASVAPMPVHGGNTVYPNGPNVGMGDPSLQEYLSPFFQPFGVDVSHFPLTNPPIFQSSLANYSDGPRRRRISISNGQISQLGDETGNFDDLYYNQPPPLPQRQEFMSAKAATQNNAMDVKIAPAHPPHPFVQQPTGLVTQPLEVQPAQMPSDIEIKDETFGEQHDSRSANMMSPFSSQHNQNTHFEQRTRRVSNHEPLPGTAAWKRARLLERNRIAASKCRQRKKVAQQQLQKDVVELSKENREMRRKLDYYEKLVSKFKKFTEIHMSSCGGSKDQLNMIEEMLKIDHNITDTSKGPIMRMGNGKS
ncbi:LAFE_0B05776g1_1 [Lachancea fermentati]|uniref:LAFE_0B05776g1_1 n=1 Tax=Lachancea fermentati TaxID=4955 RepID=A0A1G4M7Z6_LACFM|nr:LAFE_0B05776g1_1 [Lachancea fermentati]